MELDLTTQWWTLATLNAAIALLWLGTRLLARVDQRRELRKRDRSLDELILAVEQREGVDGGKRLPLAASACRPSLLDTRVAS